MAVGWFFLFVCLNKASVCDFSGPSSDLGFFTQWYMAFSVVATCLYLKGISAIEEMMEYIVPESSHSLLIRNVGDGDNLLFCPFSHEDSSSYCPSVILTVVCSCVLKEASYC